MTTMIITIDGPTASGKSSVSRNLAEKLNAYYLYTGLLYRALAYILITQEKLTLDTITQPSMELVEKIVAQFVYRYSPQTQEQIFYHEKDITPFLKDPLIDQAASILSTNSAVRERLNELQRTIAQGRSMVIDGRDSGSVVFPHADFKFFLSADQAVRAERWYRQQLARGKQVTLEQATEEIATRDARDTQRKHAPLVIPKDAYMLDNSTMNVAQTVDALLEIIQSPKSKLQQALH